MPETDPLTGDELAVKTCSICGHVGMERSVTVTTGEIVAGNIDQNDPNSKVGVILECPLCSHRELEGQPGRPFMGKSTSQSTRIIAVLVSKLGGRVRLSKELVEADWSVTCGIDDADNNFVLTAKRD